MKKFLLSDWFYILILVLIVIGVFSPLLLGKIIADEERLGYYYPLGFFYKEALRNHISFLWNPYYYGGWPSFLNQFGGFLYPLHYILFSFLPTLLAFHFSIVIAVLVGFIFSYLFGRANSFSRTGSLILSVGYLMGQTFGALTTGLSYANGFLVLPVLMFSILKARRAENFTRAIPFILLGGAGSGIGFLAGFAQLVIYSLIFAGIYTLFLDIAGSESRVLARFRASLSFVAMVAIGALAASPQIIPAFDYLNFSVRTSNYVSQVATGFKLSEFFTLFFPPFMRVPFLVSGTSGLYVGLLTIFFALSAAVFFRSKQVWFWGVSYLFMFLMALNVPGISRINNSLPILSRLSNPARWSMIATFALSFLGAMGYEKFLQRDAVWFLQKSRRIFLRLWGVFMFFLSLTAVGLAFVVLLFNRSEVRGKILRLVLAHRGLSVSDYYENIFRRSLEKLGQIFNLGDWRLAATVIFFLLAFWIVYRFYKMQNRRIFSAAVSLFFIGNLLLTFTAEYKNTLIPARLLKEEPAVIKAIKRQEKDYRSFRLITFLTGEGAFREIYYQRALSLEEQSLINREILTNQIAAIYGLENMYGYETLRTLRQNQLLDTVIAPQTLTVFDEAAAKRGGRLDQKVNQDVLRSVSVEEKKKDFLLHLNLLSTMNVKYILSFYPILDPRLKEISITGNILAPFLHLYQNTSVMPRVYFVKNPIFWRGTDRDLLLTIASASDFNNRTFIECLECVPSESSAYPKDKITIRSYTNGHLELDTDASGPRWLVFSESNIPGWVASVDGQKIPIYTANYLFLSILVPRGAHSVNFEYRGTFKGRLENIKIF